MAMALLCQTGRTAIVQMTVLRIRKPLRKSPRALSQTRLETLTLLAHGHVRSINSK